MKTNVDEILESILDLEEFGISLRKYDLPVNNQPDIASALAVAVNKIEQLHAAQSDMAAKVTELHAVRTGKLYKDEPKVKRKTKKQIEDEEIEEMRVIAHTRAMNRLKK